MYIEFDPDWND